MTKITYELDRYQADLLEIAAHAIDASGASYTRPDGGKVNFGIPGGHDIEQFERALPRLFIKSNEVVVLDLRAMEPSNSQINDFGDCLTRFVVAIRIHSRENTLTGTLLVFDAMSRSASPTGNQLRILRIIGRLLEA